MLLTIVAATPFEIAPLTQYLETSFIPKSEGRYERGGLQVRLLITGVGIPLSALQMGIYLSQEKPDLLINAGIAGAFDRSLELGQVVHVVSDRFGDLGVEEADGTFTDVHEMGLIAPDDLPFQGGELINNDATEFEFLQPVSGITVNKVHGNEDSIEKIKHKYTADIETMEGAAIFLACLQNEVRFLCIRGISNYVEKRNRASWQIELAIKNLNETLIQIGQSFLVH